MRSRNMSSNALVRIVLGLGLLILTSESQRVRIINTARTTKARLGIYRLERLEMALSNTVPCVARYAQCHAHLTISS